MYYITIAIVFKPWYNKKRHMSSKQEKALEIIKSFSPKEFGIKKAYYRIGKDHVEVMFVVDKKNASNLISYLNSLSSIIEKEIKGVKIESSVYIYDKTNKIDNVVKKEKLEKIELRNFNLAGAYAC